MTADEAKALILRQIEPSTSEGEPATFLGGLRPFNGVLPTKCFHDTMIALRTIAPKLGASTTVDRDLIAALWTLCDRTRDWALEPDGMLRRNNLLPDRDLAAVKRWHDILSYAVMVLLDGGDEAEAFHGYELLLAEERAAGSTAPR